MERDLADRVAPAESPRRAPAVPRRPRRTSRKTCAAARLWRPRTWSCPRCRPRRRASRCRQVARATRPPPPPSPRSGRRGCAAVGSRTRCRRRRCPRWDAQIPTAPTRPAAGCRGRWRRRPGRRATNSRLGAVGGSSSTPVTRCAACVEPRFGTDAPHCRIATLGRPGPWRRICHSSCGRLGHVGGELVLAAASGARARVRPRRSGSVRPVLQNRHARRDHVVEQAGEQRARTPARREPSACARAGPAVPRRGCRVLGQFVALEQRDLVIEFRQHPAGAQAGDAGADDDRVIPRGSMVFSRYPPFPQSTRYCPVSRVPKGAGCMAGRWRTKSVEQSIADTDEPSTRLRKELTWLDLAVFGVVGGDRGRHLHGHRVDRRATSPARRSGSRF